MCIRDRIETDRTFENTIIADFPRTTEDYDAQVSSLTCRRIEIVEKEMNNLPVSVLFTRQIPM